MSATWLSARIAALQPGWRIEVANDVLLEAFPPMPLTVRHKWTSAERAMEAIAGSAYEFRFWENPERRVVVFERLREPLTDGRRTYVSPDRRDRFEQDAQGFYKPA